MNLWLEAEQVVVVQAEAETRQMVQQLILQQSKVTTAKRKRENYNKRDTVKDGRGGGLVVSTLAYSSKDHSSNPDGY